MVKVTIEVPESLLGDVYVAVGTVLEHAREEADHAVEQTAATERTDGDQAAEEA